MKSIPIDVRQTSFVVSSVLLHSVYSDEEVRSLICTEHIS